jgi:hypothetical protein
VSRVQAIKKLAANAEQVLHPSTADPIIEGLHQRAKWEQIYNEFQQLKKEMRSDKAIMYLAEKYHYSEKNIERVVYR